MNQGKYVFAQLTAFLPQRVFDRIVAKYGGNKHVRHFTCWNQMLCMLYGQLSFRESLRDTVLTINAHQNKTYHLGFGTSISKSNLAEANENRNYLIYQEFAYELIQIARKKVSPNAEIQLSFQGKVYAFDSTTIDLCLNVFWWASFRKNKGAVKVHMLMDIRTAIPCFIHITEGKVHDINAMDELYFEIGSFYIFDRGYTDYERWYKIHKQLAFFVIRAKENIKYKRLYSNAKSKGNGVKFDQIVKLTNYYAAKDYPEKIRLIKFYDSETEKTFLFLTNNFELPATEIALLYKYRWQIELFFKWIKQHLKIKSFWGISLNAVKTQIFIGVIAYTLVALVKNTVKTDKSMYEIIQILGVSFFDKTPINELLNSQDLQDVKEPVFKQLTFW
jgi:hypothetical protein